jgi:hypothetical protein
MEMAEKHYRQRQFKRHYGFESFFELARLWFQYRMDEFWRAYMRYGKRESVYDLVGTWRVGHKPATSGHHNHVRLGTRR